MQSANVASTMDAFFQYCAADQVCAAAYPGLAATYRDTVLALAQSPLTIEAPPDMHAPDERMRLTSTLFEALVSTLIFYPTAYPGLPRLIATVHGPACSQGLAKVLLSTRAAMAAEVNFATNLAVECRDRPRYRDQLPPGSSVIDRLRPYGLCDDWADLGHRRRLFRPAPPFRCWCWPEEFDPVTRPSASRNVAALIGPNARWIRRFPRIGPHLSRWGIQSLRGQNRRGLYRQPQGPTRRIVRRPRRADPFCSEISFDPSISVERHRRRCSARPAKQDE